MKLFHILLILLVFASLNSCRKELLGSDYQPTTEEIISNPLHPMRDSIQTIVNKYIGMGIPGVQVTIKNDDGWLYLSGGFSKIETGSSFHSGDMSWLFSITKTYTAVLIMKEIEKGNLNPDEKIENYLPFGVLENIADYQKITLRMLLNHTSGIVNVTELPVFMVGQLNNPLSQPTIEERLSMLKGIPPVFEPGTDFMYSNSNYILLQLILENITGTEYAHLLENEIFSPLGLTNTRYKLSDDDAIQLGFPNYYFDRHANEQLENITKWNNALANASDGYGGIAATPKDVINFYDALVHGNLISAASLNEMKKWIKGVNSTEPEYGEGFEYWQFKEGSTPQFGHEGDGIACSTQIFYVPDNNTIMYININVGRQLFGPYLFKITDFKRELCRYVAGQNL